MSVQLISQTQISRFELIHLVK